MKIDAEQYRYITTMLSSLVHQPTRDKVKVVDLSQTALIIREMRDDLSEIKAMVQGRIDDRNVERVARAMYPQFDAIDVACQQVLRDQARRAIAAMEVGK